MFCPHVGCVYQYWAIGSCLQLSANPCNISLLYFMKDTLLNSSVKLSISKPTVAGFLFGKNRRLALRTWPGFYGLEWGRQTPIQGLHLGFSLRLHLYPWLDTESISSSRNVPLSCAIRWKISRRDSSQSRARVLRNGVSSRVIIGEIPRLNIVFPM